MHYEAELVAVIGKTARNVSREDAMAYVAGYTLCNDYAIRDYLENYYRPNLRVKSRDATDAGRAVDRRSWPMCADPGTVWQLQHLRSTASCASAGSTARHDFRYPLPDQLPE
jgi:hypothetical protein